MQTRLYQLLNWIRRNRKLILILAVSVLVIVLVGLSGHYARNRALLIKAENLLAHPAPLPDFIMSIRLGESEEKDGANKEMCIGICGPQGSTSEMPKSVALYLDEAVFSLGYQGIYTTNPLDFCWTDNFDGLHVARLEVEFATLGTSNYEWAFAGGPGEAGNFAMYNHAHWPPYCW